MEYVAKLIIGIFGAVTFVIMAVVMIVWQPIAWVIAKMLGINTK
jgi:hypothetical protein